MLSWEGSLEVQWPGRGPMALRIQLWCANLKFVLQDMKVKFLGFVHPNLTPLESIRGPALSVYSEDAQTTTYFSEMAASQLGLLVSASAKDAHFDHFVFYSTDKDPKVYARPLILNPKAELLESGKIQDTDQNKESNKGQNSNTTATKPLGTQSTADKQPLTVSPKVLKQVVLGALRMRGYDPGNPDYESIFKYCYKTTELVLVRQGGGNLEVVKERVEAYLKLLD